MAIFASSTFTAADDTAINGLALDVGGTWQLFLTSDFGKISGNHAYANNANASLSCSYLASGSPAGADYDVECDIDTNNVENIVGLWARVNAATTTGYLVFYSAGAWNLYKYLNGSGSSLGTSNFLPLSTFTTYGLRMSVMTSEGASVISFYVDGVLVLGPISDGTSPITAAGKAGFILTTGDAGIGSGFFIDNFVATDAGTGGGGGPTISTVTPATIVTHSYAYSLDLDIAGSNLEADAVFTFSSADVTVNTATINSASSATVNATLAAGATPDVGTIQVENPTTDPGTDIAAFTIADEGVGSTVVIPLGGGDVSYVAFGTTSKVDQIYIVDSSTAAGKTGLTNADFTSGKYLSFRRADEATVRGYTGANVLDIDALGTWANPGTGKIRFKEIDATKQPGWYEIQYEDSVFAASGLTTDQAASLTWFGIAGILQDSKRYVLYSAADIDALQSTVDGIPPEIALIKTKTDSLPDDPADQSLIAAAISALNDLSASDVQSAVLGMIIEGSITFQQSMMLANAANGGNTTGMGSSVGHLRDLANTKNRVTATLDSDRNRTVTARDLT